MRFKRLEKIFVPAVAALFIFASCSDDKTETSKSMNELQKENGVPVRTEVIKTEAFKKQLSFYSTISGIKETIKGSMIGDNVESIWAQVGNYVKKNQIVMTFPTDNPVMKYNQAKAAFEIAEKNYERMKELLEAGETSQANFDGAETKYQVAKSDLDAVKQALFVRAPISGQIVEMYVNPGDGVKQKAPLFKVAQLHKVKVTLWATAEEVRQISEGMTAHIEFMEKKYEGRVTSVSMSMDQRHRAFEVEAVFDNKNRELPGGVTVDVTLDVYEDSDAIVIPRNFVQKEEDMKYVFVKKDSTAVKRYIKTGVEEGINVVVTEGLSEGDTLITEGINQLEDGIKIKEVN